MDTVEKADQPRSYQACLSRKKDLSATFNLPVVLYGQVIEFCDTVEQQRGQNEDVTESTTTSLNPLLTRLSSEMLRLTLIHTVSYFVQFESRIRELNFHDFSVKNVQTTFESLPH